MSQRLPFKIVKLLLLALIVSVQSTFATVSVKIFMKDEGINETNIVKPRIYIQNTGTESISNFIYYYYILSDSGKTPAVDNYYTPNCTVTLENMGSGLYRVKYNFSGFTLQAGAIAPDANGNVVGVHYTDWSNLNKFEEFSYIAAGSFVEDTKIPVYSSTGILLYGADPSSGTTVPPVIPPVTVGNPPLLSQYVIYGTNQCILSDRVIVHGGMVGSKGYTEVGCNDTVYGSLSCAGNAFLRTSVKINGDVTLGGTLSLQTQDSISGSLTQNSSMVFPTIQTLSSIPIGSKDTSVPNYGSLTLAPGNYNNVHVFSNASITLSAGVYNVRSFILEPDVHLTISASQTDIVHVNVSDLLSFGDRTIMQFSGTAWGNNVRFYSNQQTQFRTGTDATIYGIITIPNAQIDIPSRTHVIGALYGQQVCIEPDATVCRPAVLSDLWYSGWVYTPAFDANTLSYSGVVDPSLSQIQVAVTAVQDATATINGRSSPATISLSGGQTTFGIDVTNNSQCGGTHYTVTINKQPDYMIYVNANSGAPASQCDGKSWYTAFKDLQQGIDTAAIKGKQVWVAEGIYKPRRMVDSTDPRSATFFIQSGQEIIGGFRGTETTVQPQGSPYNTILSGDIRGNDTAFTSWPPSDSANLAKVADNVYHVVTINGAMGASSIRLQGLKITGGWADKAGSMGIGAGIYDVRCAPTLEQCIIDHNYSVSNGAGIYAGCALDTLTNCLFKSNYSKTGNGGGLFAFSGQLNINASVFDGNSAAGQTSNGGAAYLNHGSVSMANCVLTGNTCGNDGGAICCDSLSASIINCTFYANSASLLGGGVTSRGSNVSITNTILWQNSGGSTACGGNTCYADVRGNGFTISYSDITSTYAGTGNISNNPQFTNAIVPSGVDGKWGTLDDGLQINYNSPCAGKGTAVHQISTDLLNFIRKSPDDIGAYIAAIADTGAVSWGRIDGNGNYYPLSDMQVLKNVSPGSLNGFAASYAARVYELKYPPNSSLGDSFVIDIFGTDSNGNALTQSKMIPITLYRVKMDNNLWTYRSVRINANGTVDGKMTLFINDPSMQGTYQNCYVIYCLPAAYTSGTVYYSQF